MSNKYSKLEQYVVASLKEVFQKIIATDGMAIEVSYAPTVYVANGGLFDMRSSQLNTKIWVGLNGPRFFFITYVKMSDVEEAKKTFGFCFGGAKRVGWEFYYEPIDSQTLSIWGTLMTDKTFPLALSVPGSISESFEATAEGNFWITDIGMMAQSFIRTCERNRIDSPTNMSPAPL